MTYITRAFRHFFAYLVGMPYEGATAWEYVTAVVLMVAVIGAFFYLMYVFIGRRKIPLPPDEETQDDEE